jgi:YD repeat-containing protein
MGRTTTWHKDVQNRLTTKQYGDGSQVMYTYENISSRLRQTVDEKLQTATYSYNRDDTVNSTSYANAAVPTPTVSFAYDPNYKRPTSMTDGTGTTRYNYVPITAPPSLDAGQLASLDGPLPNDTITYGYDELGRRVSTAINGVASLMTFDEAGRIVGETNALGSFGYTYDGGSGRILSETFPNALTNERSYADNLHDRDLQRITLKVGATPVSEFIYGYEKRNLGDLGVQLGKKVRARANQLGGGKIPLRPAEVRIRATVIGASQYTVQVSGNTIYLSHPELLPLRNLQVVTPQFEQKESITVTEVKEAVEKALQRFDAHDVDRSVALAIRWELGPSYPLIRTLA